MFIDAGGCPEHEAAGHSAEALGDEISTLAAHLSAATCRWLELVADFDVREGWGAWGCRSCAHWLAWRCSMAPASAREHVRVARRLRELPLVRAAFGRGALSYSQVRALTRLDAVEDEQALVELASTSTAAQLERIVRGLRQVTADEAQRAYDERSLGVLYEDDGTMVLRARLPAEDGAVVVRALEVFHDAIARAAVAGEDDRDAEAPRLAVPAEAPDPNVPAEAPTRGARMADALVTLAERALAAGPGSAPGGRVGPYEVVIHVDADRLAGPTAEAAGGQALRGQATVGDDVPVSADTARRISCDSAIVTLVERAGEPLSVGRRTRAIPPAMRRALRSRDRGCRFPGCGRRDGVDAHHIEHWAAGGETRLDNLVELCRHHHRLMHEGGFQVCRTARGILTFHRPDGRLLAQAPRPPCGDPTRPATDNSARGIRITPESPVPRWYGDRLDLGAAVAALLPAVAGER
ncbi:MAG: DUF222 domain-containing protein [Solirubrobacterales bacterium]|nr:DUF222 domain-containing protein [Solirubrobacterales bacterium]